MLNWMLTSGAIAVFAAATLELFRECGSAQTHCATAISRSPQTGESRGSSPWQSMTEEDLDRLVGAWQAEEEQGILDFNES